MPAAKPLPRLRKPLKVFISYAHKDAACVDELLEHLRLLERQQLIEVWSDRGLLPDEEWEKQLLGQLDHADIVLMLVSAAFFKSDYCYETEMPRALRRFRAKKCLATWMLLYACQWKLTPFAKLQGQPDHGKAMPKGKHARQKCWTKVAEMIAGYVERKTRPRPRKR